VSRVLADSYFGKVPPKSKDGKEMIEIFLQHAAPTHRAETSGRGQGGLPRSTRGGEKRERALEDLLGTACTITVRSIVESMRRFLKTFPEEIFVSGGGVHNATMMRMLRSAAKESVGESAVKTAEDLGIAAEAKEAMAFALLGAATLDGVPGNVPSATGARRRVVLGSVTPRP
jgi:1,6-anhydro-N-acetylmuramate kinase